MRGQPIVISVADHVGWAHVVCVAAPAAVPAVVERRRVTLIGDGLPTLPYHHDTLGMPEGEADRLIARVRRSIVTCAVRAVRGVMADLSPDYRAVALAIRTPPFPELPTSVAPVRDSYQLQCSADGMMYQLAVCRAARGLGLQVHLCRRGEETALAASRLSVSEAAMASFVSGTGRPPNPPWTQEHRRAYAAGIAALSVHVRVRLRLG
jgi:hypothetical protein